MSLETPIVDEKHWFLFSFMVQSPGVWTPQSIVVASNNQNLSIPQIVQLRKENNVPDASVIISVSYLGWMTERAINGQPDVDPPTVISEAYRQGMVAATRAHKDDPEQPVNPYDPTDSNPHIRAKSIEWSAGFVAVRTAQNDTATEVVQQKLVKPSKHTGVAGPNVTPSGTQAK